MAHVATLVFVSLVLVSLHGLSLFFVLPITFHFPNSPTTDSTTSIYPQLPLAYYIPPITSSPHPSSPFSMQRDHNDDAASSRSSTSSHSASDRRRPPAQQEHEEEVKKSSSSWFRRRRSSDQPEATAPIYVPHSSSSFDAASDPHMKETYQQMLQMTMELVEDVTLNWRPGDTLITQYGKGKLLEKTVTQPDALTSITSVKIQLEWGGAILSCPMASDVIHKLLSPKEYEKAMEHLEQVRRLSVAIQCHDWGIDTHEPEACVACLFQKPEIKSANSNRRRKRYFRTSSSATNNTKAATRKTKRCDVCANPVCSHHQHSMGNTTEGVEFFIICVDCSHDLNQAQEHLYAHHPQLLQNLQRLVQYYTRMVLQLSFSVSNLPQVAYTLTHEQQRDGAISLGNSALGFAGAALGVAGAAAMLTPAGPAILLAAVATSATSGTFQGMHASYQKFWSSKTARQMADRCLGWHGLCLGILNALEQLRRDLIEQEHDFDGKTKSSKKAQQSRQNSMDIWNALAVGSFATTRQAMTGIGVTSSLGASYSQAINTSLQGIPVVGAAFAIGCMAMDANNMASSFKQLNTPAKKAIALQGVEQSFSKHVVNTIRPTADMIIQGVDDLQERMNERRRMEEAALIEEELQGLGGEADLNSDEELERELANL